ncbi:ABC transporter substrate-binding protein [Planosporangium mesophilum]|uniref:ABC transporter substrate-binding protein n=1 Tax=Planosporangium mesophilum TaxID=689768 RepID=A0A8J3TAS7_9ACTN|nr:ABC transporter substrate-binding protein [Planosporangium mesophilum]NJC82790.1 ABC transporter substrate-binding protein [Planosporangium mesophilum]GII23740.1 ABC transporter substrate-binding protein [Planosporangium mesophilum]
MPRTPKHRRLATVLAVATACAALGFPAVASAAPADQSAGPKTLTIATNGSVDSLSPFLAQRLLPTHIHRLIYDFLTNYDPKDDHAVPALATSWSTSPDKLVWTFTIRDGMKWSDGKPVTAEDIAWTYNLIMTSPDAATGNGNFVVNFKSVAAPDPKTLVITLSKPQATMLALDIPVVPKHVWESHAADIGKFHNDTQFPIVSNGPFILSGYAKGQYIELTANPNYWRGKPKFDKVIYRYYKDSDAMVEALKKGEAHFVSPLTPAQYNALGDRPEITRNKAQGKRFYALAANPGATTKSGQAFGDGSPALRDSQFRRALMYAIDSKTLVAKTLGGYGEPGAGYLPPIWANNHWKPDAAEAYTHNPDKAGEMLDALGYRKGADGMRTTPDGQPLTLRLFGQTQRVDDTQNASYISEWLKGVGVGVTVSMMDQGKLADVETAGNYDLAFDSWSTNPDPDFVLSLQTCAGRPDTPGASFLGDTFVCDATYDELYAQQITEYDQAKRSDLVKRMQQQLYRGAYVNVLYYANVLEAYRSDVIGSMQKQPQPNGMYYPQDGYWAWWSATPATAAPKKSGNTGAIVAGVATAAIIGAAGVLFATRRRRAGADDRE